MTAAKAETVLKKLATPEAAARQMTFFKTGKGQYGEGDKFLGVTVPVLRGVAKQFKDLGLKELERLLHSPYNESRLLALLVLGGQYKHGDEKRRAAIYRLYLKNARRVNNWNLVDASAHYIVGEHLLTNDRKILYKLVRSENLWERRIAVVSTFAFIRRRDFKDILKLSAILLEDEQDLMHKACGWMLREVGKKHSSTLEKFLKTHAPKMPRTMLRYAIERFPEQKRKAYLMN